MFPLPTGTVTFLFTDIVDSTQLWEQHHTTMTPVLTRHNILLRTAIETHRGVVFKLLGDGVCAAFANALDAVAAALAAQRVLVAEPWEVTPVQVRIALHTGVVDAQDGSYVGQPHNRVARLLVAGHGGQVLLSRATMELIRDQLPPGVALRDLGEHRLKDLFRSEHIFQLLASDLPTDFPPLLTLNQRQTNLPVQLTPLVGREQEVAAVCAILRRASVRLLTLSGPGGAGKTRLGLQVAADLLDDFPDGVYFVALSAITDASLLASTIAQILGIREAGSRHPLELLRDYLHDKRLLLLLDNFEQLIDASVVVTNLLEQSPGLKILVTSRVVLHLYGEHEYAVPPLALPDLKSLPSLEHLTHYEAVRLFIERAQAAKADFTVTNETAPAVAEICVRLDGLPLAIELAAARVKILSPQALLARLNNRLQLLIGGARNLPVRHQTLRDTIAWSYSLLDIGEQQLFTRLGIFADGCTLEAATAVCDVDDRLGDEMLDKLGSLVDKSLLRQDTQADGEPRFRMLETIREYAWEELKATNEWTAVQKRHAAYYLALAETAEPALVSSQQHVWLERLEREHDNMRLVLQRSLEQGDVELAARLGSALYRFWWIRGHLSEGRQWLEQILARHQALPDTVRAKVSNAAGVLTAMQGDLTHAAELFEASLALARELENTKDVAKSLGNLGTVLQIQGDYVRSRELLEEALVLDRKLNNPYGVSVALTNLGWNALIQGENAEALTYFEESLALAREQENHQNIATYLVNMGLVALAEGEVTQAHDFLAESVTLSQQLGDQQTLASGLEGLGGVVGMRSQPVRAAQLFGAAEALRDRIGAPIPPDERAFFERYLAPARAHLSDTAFAAAWAEGRAMPVEQTIASALEAVAQAPSPPSKEAYPAGLTAREAEVLRLVAQGLTDPQVAEQLVLSPRTVNSHLTSIYSKLGVNSRTAAARFALDHGLT